MDVAFSPADVDPSKQKICLTEPLSQLRVHFVPRAMAVDGAAPRNQQPDFIRYYLQFPPVTRTLLSAIFVISICLQFNIISRYTLYTSFLGSFLRFFDAGWGFGFLIALITCIPSLPSCSDG